MKSLKSVSQDSQRTLLCQSAQRAANPRGAFLLAFAALLIFSLSSMTRAATLPSGYAQTQVASGLQSPVAMEFAPDGRLFVSEQAGRVRVIKNGLLLSTPFVDLTGKVDSTGERGVVGIAFDPNFSTNHYVYIYYTSNSPVSHNRVSRFVANGDVAVAGSEVVIFELNNLGESKFHNGGAIHFGAGSKLFISTGDANFSDNGDSFQNLLGKILRINADGTIPADNPFYNTTTGNNRAIWSLGLRNPYTFSFHPTTGRMFINDVGENTWEEINDGVAGSHYGWPLTEGPTTNPGYRSPIYAYMHGTGLFNGCAITGGTFYAPPVQQFPASFLGVYFFADYCGGWINFIDPANLNGNAQNFASGISAPVDLKVGPEGSLYYLARGAGSNTGEVVKISYTLSQPPPTDPDAVYLSDLQWASALNGYGPVELDKSNGEADPNDGRTITLNGATYAKGLGVHAASEIIYYLNGNYSTFTTDVGVDDEASSGGSVTFEVWADGTKLFDSGLMTVDSATKSVTVSVIGKTQLKLVVTDGGNGNAADHADWAGAKLTRGSNIPVITKQPVSQTVLAGQSVNFTVVAEGSGLGYRWFRNGVLIPGATSPNYSIASVTTADNGARFSVEVYNIYGSVVSSEALLSVGGNQVPTATILTPQAGALYSGGDTISFSGTATDAEDGQLPASAFTWEVEFHHDAHTHPFLSNITGVKSGSFQIPTVGETSANVWYRIILTVKDSSGSVYTTYRDVFPRKSRLTFLTSPSGLQITVDGQPRTTPFTIEGVVGITRTLGVIDPQTFNGATYNFSSWSDGGAATHSISTPATDTTYTALFTGASTLSDNFNDNSRDAKWQLGILNEPAGFDTQVGVFERNQRLEIVPRANVSGSHYNGYVSTTSWDVTNKSVSVEVLQVATGGADTVFAIGVDANNWYRFVVENGTLFFQDEVNGVKTSRSVTYDPAQHHFWRFRHDTSNDTIVFETSSDGQVWQSRASVPRRFAAMRVELDAGTFAPVGAPGTAIFDNFRLESNTAIQPTPTVGFLSTSVSFNEADPAGAVTLTVTRGGSVDVAVSVDYSTSDLSGLTPCQTNTNGIASERCDYATVAGTLRFAAGEVSKTIQIPIINDAYVEPNEGFTVTLKNATGGIINGGSTAVSIISDDTQAATTNPIDNQAFFIKQQYVDFLGRVAEPAGFQFWMDRMTNCPAGQICDRVDTSLRFFQSDEFQLRGFFVYRLYDEVLGRLPKYAEFVPDVARLNGFQTPDEQRQSKASYLLDFINKQEFRNIYGAYLSADGLTAVDAAGFVNTLCAKAGITPAYKQPLIDNLQAGVITPAQILNDFILQPELSNVGTLYYDRGYITMQYFGYLRRDPEQAGFNFWLGQLRGANAPHRLDYRFMVGGFIGSDEYRYRFAQR